ncbi:MAG TPA: hypothetical protein GXX59_11255 [Syntrophomonadaceae bacterium]|nr:hypothetical protein [Syntrophomonadaceae bacterium]
MGENRVEVVIAKDGFQIDVVLDGERLVYEKYTGEWWRIGDEKAKVNANIPEDIRGEIESSIYPAPIMYELEKLEGLNRNEM